MVVISATSISSVLNSELRDLYSSNVSSISLHLNRSGEKSSLDRNKHSSVLLVSSELFATILYNFSYSSQSCLKILKKQLLLLSFFIFVFGSLL